jgi:hypothetical protein
MWAQLCCVLLGLWLMAAPYVLGYDEPASHSDHVLGPLIASFAAIALWEVTRGLRWVNVLLALWLIAAPWALGFAMPALVNSVVVGLAVAGLSLVRGRVSERFGGGWTVLWRTS